MKEHFFIRCIVFCIALVDATDRHLRGSTFDTARLSLNQLILGGLPIAQEDCPLSDPAKDCTSEPLEVVSCRSCEYDNACLATGAGFLYRRDCLFSFEVNDDPDNFGNNLNCRAIPPTSLCLDLIDPVICNDCEYGNDCFAATAGYDLDTECQPVATPPPVDENFINPVFLKNCPIPNEGIFCFDIGVGVVCGEDECLYNSTCAAVAAGYNTTSCGPAPFDPSLCPAVSFTGTFCAEDEPVVCKECFYDSVCQANSAGYLSSLCGPIPEVEPELEDELGLDVLTDTDEGDESPIPQLESTPCETSKCPVALLQVVSACPSTVDPLTCNGCCEYSNQCLAAGAGFNSQLECQALNPRSSNADNTSSGGGIDAEELADLDPSECPPITDRIPCTGAKGGSNEVVCRGCVYGNGCLAAGAGFSGQTCNAIGSSATPATPITDDALEKPATADTLEIPATDALPLPAIAATDGAPETAGIPTPESDPEPVPVVEVTQVSALTSQPSKIPSSVPSSLPTSTPSDVLSTEPTQFPSSKPSDLASSLPTRTGTLPPSTPPTPSPTNGPSSLPSSPPSPVPSSSPSGTPSTFPSSAPSVFPTTVPTGQPSSPPSSDPSSPQSLSPSSEPSAYVCPILSGRSCFVPLVPVLCGASDCEYRSRCDALKAGFRSSDCTSASIFADPYSSGYGGFRAEPDSPRDKYSTALPVLGYGGFRANP